MLPETIEFLMTTLPGAIFLMPPPFSSAETRRPRWGTARADLRKLSAAAGYHHHRHQPDRNRLRINFPISIWSIHHSSRNSQTQLLFYFCFITFSRKKYANFKIMYPHHRTILDKRRPKKDGLFPVKVRVTFQQAQKYFPVGVDLTQEDFDRVMKSPVSGHL